MPIYDKGVTRSDIIKGIIALIIITVAVFGVGLFVGAKFINIEDTEDIEVMNSEPLSLEYKTLYPIYGQDHVRKEWVVVFEIEDVNLPPDDFPLEWRYIPEMNRLVFDVPMKQIFQ